MKTRTFKLNKLVRDKIVDDHIKNGAKVNHHKLSKEDKIKSLANKIIEEISEGTDLSELADVQEAIDQIIKDQGLTKEQVAETQKAKRAKNGGFENGDFIDTETWPADHKWANYYAAEPARFPEVK
jgi:predicted house-cleaning noncanonical NTP pyrophosphatase (MazG superfamily)